MVEVLVPTKYAVSVFLFHKGGLDCASDSG